MPGHETANDPKRVVVFGASGGVGRRVVEQARQWWSLVGSYGPNRLDGDGDGWG